LIASPVLDAGNILARLAAPASMTESTDGAQERSFADCHPLEKAQIEKLARTSIICIWTLPKPDEFVYPSTVIQRGIHLTGVLFVMLK
jgi:hypothetical protein